MSWLDTLTIDSEADAIITMRVSALVAISNTIPVALTATDLMNGRMCIVVVLRNLDADKAACLAMRIESIPTVTKVQVSRMWRRGSDAGPRAQSAI